MCRYHLSRYFSTCLKYPCIDNIFKVSMVFNCMDVKNTSHILTPVVRNLDFQVWRIIINTSVKMLGADIFAHIFVSLIYLSEKGNC